METVVIRSPLLERAYRAAHKRQKGNVEKGEKDRFGCSSDYRKGLHIHMAGCIAEAAAAQYYKLEEVWVAYTVDFKNLPADVGDVLEVRSTEYVEGRLILHGPEKDAPDKPYLLVRVQRDMVRALLRRDLGYFCSPDARMVSVVGWTTGAAGRSGYLFDEDEKGGFWYLANRARPVADYPGPHKHRPAFYVNDEALRPPSELDLSLFTFNPRKEVHCDLRELPSA